MQLQRHAPCTRPDRGMNGQQHSAASPAASLIKFPLYCCWMLDVGVTRYSTLTVRARQGRQLGRQRRATHVADQRQRPSVPVRTTTTTRLKILLVHLFTTATAAV